MRLRNSFLSRLHLRIKYKKHQRKIDFILSDRLYPHNGLPDDIVIVVCFDPKAYFYLSYSENILFLSVSLISSLMSDRIIKHEKPR
jgi:hypothetical protein